MGCMSHPKLRIHSSIGECGRDQGVRGAGHHTLLGGTGMLEGTDAA